MRDKIKQAIQSRITPEHVTDSRDWPPNAVFVFGSNLKGIHGKGAALTAKLYWGAINGHGQGRMGQSYAIPTKAHPRGRTLFIAEISSFVEAFQQEVSQNPESLYLVSAIGCGLAGYRPGEIAPLFGQLVEYSNVMLPESFWSYFNTQ
jgi:hypothetical protein